MKPDDDHLPTRWTLVAGIKNPDDEKRWGEFYDLYQGVILGVARKAGLREDEAQDVLQETMKAVSRNIAEFVADPGHGSFRAWLFRMVRWRIDDQRRKRLPVGGSSPVSGDATATTPTVERVADTRAADLVGLCDAEWEKAFLQEGLKRLRLKVTAAHYQIFHLLEIDRMPVAQVARKVGRNAAQIYLVRHRVTNALKQILKRLEKDLEWRPRR